MFGDVRVVVMGGSTDRIAVIARTLAPLLAPGQPEPQNIARSDRFVWMMTQMNE